MTRHPNVLLVLCDQLRADALGCYGSAYVRTPVMDALAARGTVFERAYTPSPVCVPARASLLTGREPYRTGCYDNGFAMPDVPTFLHRLADRGYRTHGVGKMHFTPDPAARRGFGSRDTGEELATPDTDDYLAHVAAAGYGHVEQPHGLRSEMYYVPQLSPVPEPLHYSHWVADRSVAFLRSQDRDTPFLLWSSFVAPHPPFAPPSPWHRLFEPALMPDPYEPAGGPGLLTTYNVAQNRYKGRDGGGSGGPDRRLTQLIRAYYHASVAYADAQLGRILAALEETGRADETLVVLTADHGEFLGDYGCFGKRSFLDAAARVPLVCAGPGFVAGQRIDAPVSLVDVAPTLVGADEAFDGVPLGSATGREAVYGQFQTGELGLYAVIGERWKYVWSAPDRREYLLDRRSDPQESRNLAYNVRARDDLLRLRALATAHFPDLHGLDLDAASGNVPTALGLPAEAGGAAGLNVLASDPDAGGLLQGEPGRSEDERFNEYRDRNRNLP